MKSSTLPSSVRVCGRGDAFAALPLLDTAFVGSYRDFLPGGSAAAVPVGAGAGVDVY